MIAQLLKYFPIVFRQLARICGIPYKLAQSAVPVILAPNGTWTNTTGAFTLGTNLPTTYSGGAWVRFAGVGVNGSTGGPAASGLYWCTFSSATAGQAKAVSADASQPFTPYIPSGNPANLTTTAGTHVQTTGADVTLANVTVSGGAMGLNGGLRSKFVAGVNNTAGNKLGKTLFANTLLRQTTSTTTTGQSNQAALWNRGVPTIQTATIGVDTTAFGPVYMSANTAIDQALILTGQIAVATDVFVLEAFLLEVIPS